MKENGDQQIRWFHFMARPIDRPLPAVTLPGYLEVRPIPEGRYRDVFGAQNEAFRDHWGHVEATEEDYRRFLTESTFDPSLWKVAWMERTWRVWS